MKYSITTKITIIFAIAFSLMCLLFVTFANIQQESALEKLKDKQLHFYAAHASWHDAVG